MRLLSVAPAAHAWLQQKGELGAGPFGEYFAKNVGIRAARGRFVLAHNPDAVFSPELVGFLAGRSLRQDSVGNRLSNSTCLRQFSFSSKVANNAADSINASRITQPFQTSHAVENK